MEADDQRYQDMLMELQGVAKGWPMPWTLAKTTDTAVDLLSAQLQDANRRILALEAELQRYTSRATVSVPLADWNRLCAEAAKASQIPAPVAEESFPGRALRYSWGTK